MSISSLITSLVSALVIATASAEDFITARDLLAPDIFPDASFGMAVETVEDGAVTEVTTTGSVFRIRKEFDAIECDQRIPRAASGCNTEVACRQHPRHRTCSSQLGGGCF